MQLSRFLWLVLLSSARSAAALTVAGLVDDVASHEGSYLAHVVAGDGQFLVTLALGTPPSPFTAILDTGSTLLWRQCLPCQLCYPQAPLPTPLHCTLHRNYSSCNSLETVSIFDPLLSSSYSTATCSDSACLAYPGSCSADNTTCTYDIVYIAPSAYTQGVLSYDTLSLFSLLHSHKLVSVPQFAFGCSHSSKAPYNFVGAGGIVGLGRGPLSLPTQLNVTRFAYCLGSIHDTSSRTPLVLGAGARLPRSAAADIQSMQVVDAIDFAYVVEIEAISVGGKRLTVATSSLGLNLTGFSPHHKTTAGIVFDSGTTFTHLPTPAFIALSAAFSDALSMPRSSSTPRNLSLCYQSQLPGALPSLSFHFYGGASMHLPPANYFISIDEVFCLAFLQSPDDLAILGNVQQQNYHILYDLQAHTISFTPAHCRSLHTRSR
ncbi:hypothetical protein L7F22_024782 [Adiantum nelumboides]|nr:hypothetical protein [Adiantum nelumboides]